MTVHVGLACALVFASGCLTPSNVSTDMENRGRQIALINGCDWVSTRADGLTVMSCPTGIQTACGKGLVTVWNVQGGGPVVIDHCRKDQP